MKCYTWLRVSETLEEFLIDHPFATAPAEISIIPPASQSPSQPLSVVFVPKSVPEPYVVGMLKTKLLSSNSWLYKPGEGKEEKLIIHVDPAISSIRLYETT